MVSSSLFQVLSASGGQIIAVQNPALSMSLPIRAPSTSPTSSSSHQDSKNLVNLLNLSRRGGLVNPAAAAAAAAAAIAAASATQAGNTFQKQADHNATSISQKNLKTASAQGGATTIIHSDDEEMTFKQEPASPPRVTPPVSAMSASEAVIGQPRTNGK